MGARHRPNNMINPQVFVGEKFTIDAETVMIAGYPAGFIKQSRSRYDKGRWEWRITATLMPRGITSSGMAISLDEAQRAFRQAFDQWLAYSLKHVGHVMWNGADSERDMRKSPNA